MSEIIFEVTEDEVDGGYSASAIGYGIHTQGDSMEETRRNVWEAVDCYFDKTMEQPGIIRRHWRASEVIPHHNPIRVKTLSSILKSVARHHGMTVDDLLAHLGL